MSELKLTFFHEQRNNSVITKVGNKNGTSLTWFLRNRHAIESCRTYISFLQTGFSLRDKGTTNIFVFLWKKRERERLSKRLCCQCEVSNSNVDLTSFPFFSSFSFCIYLSVYFYLTTIVLFLSLLKLMDSLKCETSKLPSKYLNQATHRAHKSTLRYMQIRPAFLTVVNSACTNTEPLHCGCKKNGNLLASSTTNILLTLLFCTKVFCILYDSYININLKKAKTLLIFLFSEIQRCNKI